MEQVTIIEMPLENDYHILTRYKSDKDKVIIIYMTYISQDEEFILDKQEELNITRGNREFIIKPREVYCYGNVNLNTNSTDYNIIDGFDFLNYLSWAGLKIVSNYTYKTHKCSSPHSKPLWTETWSPAEIAQYAHACLNKPERIVLFKEIIDKKNDKHRHS